METAPARTARADTTALTLGSIVSGLAGYGFVVVGTRSVGAQAFAPASILWLLWAISAAATTFPIQYWVIRTVEVEGHEEDVWAGANAAAQVVLTSGPIALSLPGGPSTPVMTLPARRALLRVPDTLTRGSLLGRQATGSLTHLAAETSCSSVPRGGADRVCREGGRQCRRSRAKPSDYWSRMSRSSSSAWDPELRPLALDGDRTREVTL